MDSCDALLYRRGLYVILSARGVYPAKFGGKNGPVPDNAADLTGRLGIYIHPLPDGFFHPGIEAENLPRRKYQPRYILHPCQCPFCVHDALGILYLFWRDRKPSYLTDCLVCLEMAQGQGLAFKYLALPIICCTNNLSLLIKDW